MLPTFRLAACLALLACTAAMASEPVREKTVSLRVRIDAAGNVQSALPLPDPEAVETLSNLAVGLARKLAFKPAKRDGVAIASETTLYLKLRLAPQADGRFGVSLAQASNGPHVVDMGKLRLPQNKGLRSRAMIVVGVSLRANGRPDVDSLKVESVEMKEGSSFVEARYVAAIAGSLRDSLFELDRVGDTTVPTRAHLPYRFGGGGRGRGNQGDEEGDEASSTPGVSESSEQAGVELPQVIFTQAAASK